MYILLFFNNNIYVIKKNNIYIMFKYLSSQYFYRFAVYV